MLEGRKVRYCRGQESRKTACDFITLLRNGVLFQTCEIPISGVFHFIFSDQCWPQGTETKGSETAIKGKLLYNPFPTNLFPNFSSVTQPCSALCDDIDYSKPGFPVHHQYPELTQAYVHWLGDATQPSNPLSSPSCPAFSLSQQGLFKRQRFTSGGQFEFQLQHQSFQWIFRTDFLSGRTGWISLLSKGLWRALSNTTVQKH